MTRDRQRQTEGFIALALFALIVVVAVIAHRGVEQPAQRLIDRWTKPKTA